VIPDVALRLAVAALGGLAVGVEREWSMKKRHRPPRFAGVRTFPLIGLLGGLGAEISGKGASFAGIAIVIAVAALSVAAYVMASRGGDLDGTTEVAALVVLAAGFLAGAGHLALAAAIDALTAFVLVEKTRIHSAVEKISSETLEAAARFAVLALVILPILPEGPFGPPPGFRPRELWALALVFSGISFAGYLALKLFGARRGWGLAGLLGGIVSSTAVTLLFSRESRRKSAPGGALALGVVAACTVLPVRVGLVVTALAPQVALAAIRYLLPVFVAGVAVCLLMLRRDDRVDESAPTPKNPLRFAAALPMAAGLQLVLYLMSWARDWLGDAGVMGSAALLGLTDVDALVYSLTKLSGGNLTAAVAAKALAVGILANTLLKLGIAAGVGHGVFRRWVIGGLLLMAAAIGVSLLVW
jgi:uncharacterized membrane protein (DUF4010 family)